LSYTRDFNKLAGFCVLYILFLFSDIRRRPRMWPQLDHTARRFSIMPLRIATPGPRTPTGRRIGDDD